MGLDAKEECQGGSINETKGRVRQGTTSKGRVQLDSYEFRTSDSQHSENYNFNNLGRRRTRMEVVILICIQIAYLFHVFKKNYQELCWNVFCYLFYKFKLLIVLGLLVHFANVVSLPFQV